MSEAGPEYTPPEVKRVRLTDMPADDHNDVPLDFDRGKNVVEGDSSFVDDKNIVNLGKLRADKQEGLILGIIPPPEDE